MVIQSTTRTTLKSLSTQTIMSFALAILSLVSFSIMSRLLTKEDFGYYAAISAITAIFETLTEAGFGSAVIQRKTVEKKYIDTAFSLGLYSGIIFAILLLALSFPIAIIVADTSLTTPLQLMSISVFFFSLNSITKANMTRNLDFKKIGVYNIYSQIAGMFVGISCAYFGMGYYAIIVQNILVSIFTFVIFYVNMDCRPQWFIVNKIYAREILSYGGWLTASCIFRTVYQQMDKLLTGRWLSISTLGTYNRPSGFISHISIRLNGILDTVLFPILSSLQDDKEKIRRAYDKLIYAINLYSGLICIIMIMANKCIIDIFFGKEWESISILYCIICLSLLLSVNGRIMDCFIRSLAFVKMGFYMRILACLITFSCLYIGKDYGVYGIAYSVIISNYLIIFIKLWYIGYKIEVPFYWTLWLMFKPLRLTILPFVIFVIFRETISSNLCASLIATSMTLVYYIILFVFMPSLIGNFIMDFVYAKFPNLKKMRII